MHIGNKAKRNIYLALTILGCLMIALIIFDTLVYGDGFERKDWIHLTGNIVFTLLWFDSYRNYRKRIDEQ